MMCSSPNTVTPAKAGTQIYRAGSWIPAYAGTTKR